jgi:hypothetical protein
MVLATRTFQQPKPVYPDLHKVNEADGRPFESDGDFSDDLSEGDDSEIDDQPTRTKGKGKGKQILIE